MSGNKHESARQSMVETQLVRRGIHDERVLDAMRRVPRHVFVAESQSDIAYADCALPIEGEQTISQPYIVALMLQALALHPTDHVLDVGTGSGYLAALAATLSKDVISIERIAELAENARARLAQAVVDNVRVVLGDGMQGYAAHAPYDAIVVSAATANIPPLLIDQLAEGGRLVIPLGDRNEQRLMLVRKEQGDLTHERLCDCRFVPLLSSIAAPN